MSTLVAVYRPMGRAEKASTTQPRLCFLSPIHAEKYLDAAKLALEYAAKDPRSRAKFLIAKPGPE